MNIKTLTALPLAIILGVLAAVLITVTMQSSPAHAAEPKKEDAKKTATYSYVAQPGDSYSKIARKAVQTYGIKNEVDLSRSRILYAETNLTQAADSPQLIQGQKVEIPEATVKNWVDKAKDLKNDQAAKWDKYAVGVNFDTNNVGESQK